MIFAKLIFILLVASASAFIMTENEESDNNVQDPYEKVSNWLENEEQVENEIRDERETEEPLDEIFNTKFNHRKSLFNVLRKDDEERNESDQEDSSSEEIDQI